jgi:tRNA pseudouridine38-40 synthase
MHRYFIRLAYNGRDFHGWQQQDNAPSVQGAITGALSMILSEKISLVGCGRTDTGVHAREFFAHFELPLQVSQSDLDHLAFRLNRFLPASIVIFWIREVDPGLHARFSALSRTYRYYIHTFKDPFLEETSWYVHDLLDHERMEEGCKMLLATSDFTSFSKLHSAAKTNICHLTEAAWTRDGSRLVFTVTADRFLRNMVRAMVGTLVDLGKGKITIEDLKAIIEAKDRSDAGQSVPAHGLFLEKIIYPKGQLNF